MIVGTAALADINAFFIRLLWCGRETGGPVEEDRSSL